MTTIPRYQGMKNIFKPTTLYPGGIRSITRVSSVTGHCVDHAASATKKKYVVAKNNSFNSLRISNFFLKKEVARGGEQTRGLLISFISHFHHFTAEPQRLMDFRLWHVENVSERGAIAFTLNHHLYRFYETPFLTKTVLPILFAQILCNFPSIKLPVYLHLSEWTLISVPLKAIKCQKLKFDQIRFRR
jgi:hypothetical protein